MRNSLLMIVSIMLPLWLIGCKPDTDLDDEIERTRVHERLAADKDRPDTVEADQDDARKD